MRGEGLEALEGLMQVLWGFKKGKVSTIGTDNDGIREMDSFVEIRTYGMVETTKEEENGDGDIGGE